MRSAHLIILLYRFLLLFFVEEPLVIAVYFVSSLFISEYFSERDVYYIEAQALNKFLGEEVGPTSED